MNSTRGLFKRMEAGVSLLAVLVCVLLGGCAFPQAPGQDEPPSVTITEPASAASVPADSHITVSATASGGVPITRVELWLDGELVGTQESSAVGGISPFDVSFELLVPPGEHTLFVRAVNAAGLMGNSAPVNISGGEELVSPGTLSTAEATVGPVGPIPSNTPVGPIPGNTPVAPTVQPQEPVEISLFAKEGRVAANAPVVLRFGWETDTSQQAADFLSAAELIVRLDGELLPDSGQYWSAVEETADLDAKGQANYQTFWRYTLGVLTPGTHHIEAELRFQRAVTDGFDANGDGALDEYSGTMPFSLPIVVGD